MAPDPDALTAALHTLRRDPKRTALLLDLDGTLAPIVEDPEAAVPLPGAVDALVGLAARFGVVAVVSGRPAGYLQRHLPREIGLVGLYGLERVVDGEIEPHPEAARWRSVVADLVTEAERELPDGVGVEDKGLSLTLSTPSALGAGRRRPPPDPGCSSAGPGCPPSCTHLLGPTRAPSRPS